MSELQQKENDMFDLFRGAVSKSKVSKVLTELDMQQVCYLSS